MAKVLALITTNDWRSALADIEAGVSPRRDYLELANALGADILDIARHQDDAEEPDRHVDQENPVP